MPTLIERAGRLFEEKKAEAQKSPESAVYNPLGAKINSVLKIENIDHIGKEYLVKELLNYDFGTGEKVSCYVARTEVDEKTIRLRLLRDEGRVRSIVCTLHDELDEEPGITDAVNDRGGIFVITTGGKESRYTRMGDMRTARPAKVVRLSDRNGDGEITHEEVETWQADCWDFSRTTEIDQVKVREYLFVERTKLGNNPKKRFRIWTGLEVLPDRVSLD